MGGGGSKVQYPLKETAPLSGMFNGMRILNDGSLKGIVDVKVSSKSSRCINEPIQIVEGPYDGEFTSENQPDQWVEIHVLSKKFDILGYTIKTYSGAKNQMHMKGWKIEVSNDGFDWALLDKEENVETLNDKNAVFSKNVLSVGSYSHIRISMLGKNCFGTNCMSLSNFEVFGNME